MKALTLWPEWAWAVCHMGKRIENRKWTPPTTLVGQRLAIHAGACFGGRQSHVATKEGLRALGRAAEHDGWEVGSADGETLWRFARELSWFNLKVSRHGDNRGEVLWQSRASREWQPIARRAVVATVHVEGSVEGQTRQAPWHEPFQRGWILSDVQMLEPPIPWKGQQGLWTFPNNMLKGRGCWHA